MSYLVLARKWRPRSFDTLIGQDHVVRALTNALSSGRLHHAWLFTGTRGVGKTTLSRILAKSLNCVQGVTASPCGQCQACTEIDAGRFVDYIELDAASNRGVDEMTQLLEQAVYAPSSGRYKVYMIDEVHMLTGHAFNAMLKTLEEPPEHVKFILATTDPQKIPVTVLSRCLQFNLKQMTVPAIVEHLQDVLAHEGIPAEPQGLQLIAHAAAGSMRDALSLTDQAISFSNNNLSAAAVGDMLGTLDQHHLVSLLRALAAGDAAGILAVADGLAARGLSFQAALGDLAVLLSRVAIAQRLGHAQPDDPLADDVRLLAEALAPDDLQLFYAVAVHSRQELALAPDEYAGFVMACLRMLALLPADRVPPVIMGAPPVRETASGTASVTASGTASVTISGTISEAASGVASGTACETAFRTVPGTAPAPTLKRRATVSVAPAAPESAQPKPAEPESAGSESAEPELAVSESAVSESAVSGPAEPEPAEPESAEPESAEPEPADSESAVPEAAAPESAVSKAPASEAVPPARLVPEISVSALANAQPAAPGSSSSEPARPGLAVQEPDLQGPDLRESDLQESDLQESDLRESDLRESDLRESDLQGPDVEEPDLREPAAWEGDAADPDAVDAGDDWTQAVPELPDDFDAIVPLDATPLDPDDLPDVVAGLAAAPAASVAKTAETPDPAAMTARDWPAVAARLPVSGAARALARNSEWLSGDAHQIRLRVAIQTLTGGGACTRLRTVLSEHFGRVLRLEVEHGATGDDTAHAVDQAERGQRQQAAEQAAAQDPLVGQLARQFAAQIVPGSIHPPAV